MRVTLTTVIDITETNARRHDDKLSRNQQTNYLTVLQTVGLRVNAEPISCESHVAEIDDFGFGSSIKGKQRYWKFVFDHEYQGAVTLDTLTSDFDLVPIITGLNETANINNNAFRTKDEVDKNIVFNIADN
jgi:hypothetical protein